MSKPEQQPPAASPERPSDELVLAAVERGARQRPGDARAVTFATVLAHLDIPRRSTAARHVGIRLEVLRQEGPLHCTRRHGVAVWQLTCSGLELLRRQRLAGAMPALPEAPQHRAWRGARTAAAQEIERFRQDVSDRLEEARRLLHADPPAHSDDWFELGQRLHRACWRLASASHCLHEWPEPRDDRPDADRHSEPGDRSLGSAERARLQARRRGRRNVHLWHDEL